MCVYIFTKHKICNIKNKNPKYILNIKYIHICVYRRKEAKEEESLRKRKCGKIIYR